MARSAADEELRRACEAAIEDKDQKIVMAIRVSKGRAIWGKSTLLGRGGNMAKPRVLALSTESKGQSGKSFLRVLKYSSGGVLEPAKLYKLKHLSKVEVISNDPSGCTFMLGFDNLRNQSVAPSHWTMRSINDRNRLLLCILNACKEILGQLPKVVGIDIVELALWAKENTPTIRAQVKPQDGPLASVVTENDFKVTVEKDLVSQAEEEDMEALLGTYVMGIGEAEAFSERLKRELLALEAANVHAILENEPLIEEVLQGLESATICVDDMDEWLGIFNVKLRHMRQDIESIETRNNKLEMHSVNNELLIKELDKLLERLRVPSEYAASLTGGSFDEARMLQNVEACEWLTGALRSLEAPQLDSSYSKMRAVKEKRQELEKLKTTFVRRASEFLRNYFSSLVDFMISDKSYFSQRGQLKRPDHADLRYKCRTYARLLQHLKSLDKNCLGPLRKAYCHSLNLLLRREAREFANELRASTKAPRSPSVWLEASSGSSQTVSSADTSTVSEAYAKMLTIFIPLLVDESSFFAHFMCFEVPALVPPGGHGNDSRNGSSDNEGNDDDLGIMDIDENDDKTGRSADLGTLNESLHELLDGIQEDFNAVVDWAYKIDPLRCISMHGITERYVSGQKADAAGFVRRLLEELESKITIQFNRFVDEACHQIERNERNVRQMGVLSYIPRFATLATRMEQYIQGQSRDLVDQAYTKFMMNNVSIMDNEDFLAFMEDSNSIGANVATTTVQEGITVPTPDDPDQDSLKGKTFLSIKEAEESYRAFAGSHGFSIRRRSCYKRGRSEVHTAALFVCSYEGNYKKTDKEVGTGASSRMGSYMRSNCMARMFVNNPVREDHFTVTVFDNNHNHELVSPTKHICLRSNRSMNEVARSLTETFYNEGLPACKVPRLFGNIVDVPFSPRDCWNHMRDFREKYNDGDAQSVRTYFEEKSREYPHFFYAIDTDNIGRAVNFFWVDGRSRMSYGQFGDAITFDTTYRTNKYSMPFAPFTGVNHHRQSILFGCALLGNEVEDTFVWVFQKWLEAMGGKAPQTIITDQDKAMALAIQKVLPNSRHRYCYWHIKKKFAEKCSHVYFKKSKFKKTVKECVKKSYTIKDFEEKWEAMIKEYELEKNTWLRDIYSIRDKWVPVFCRNSFFAGMNTTQRSESINSFFNGFVSPKTDLRTFVKKYDQALETIYIKERQEDYVSIYKFRVLVTKDLLLEHAAEIYTKNIFEKVRKQFEYVCRLSARDVGTNGDVVNYMVRFKVGIPVEWVVTFDGRNEQGSCSCQLFEFSGIPCKHLLKVFDKLELIRIPKSFVLNRWTKRANRGDVYGPDGLSIRDSRVGTKASRISYLCKRAIEIAYRAGTSEEGFNLFSEMLDQAWKTQEELDDNLLRQENNHAPIAETCISRVDGFQSVREGTVNGFQSVGEVLLDPYISVTKGRKKGSKNVDKEINPNKRIKGGMEIAQQKKG